jgi:hypothetical protein
MPPKKNRGQQVKLENLGVKFENDDDFAWALGTNDEKERFEMEEKMFTSRQKTKTEVQKISDALMGAKMRLHDAEKNLGKTTADGFNTTPQNLRSVRLEFETARIAVSDLEKRQKEATENASNAQQAVDVILTEKREHHVKSKRQFRRNTVMSDSSTTAPNRDFFGTASTPVIDVQPRKRVVTFVDPEVRNVTPPQFQNSVVTPSVTSVLNRNIFGTANSSNIPNTPSNNGSSFDRSFFGTAKKVAVFS